MREVIGIEAEDGRGDDDETEARWTEIATMRAAVKPVRASESEREGAMRTVQVYLFQVHTADLRTVAVTARHRIRWGQIVLNVREVRHPPANDPITEIVAEAGVTH